MFRYLLLVTCLSLLPFTLYSKERAMEKLLGEYISWASKTDKQGLKLGKPLQKQDIELAKEIGIQHPEKVRIVYTETVPFPEQNKALKAWGEELGLVGNGIVNNAQVFGYSIYVRYGYELNRPKLAHELVHVLQIERSSLEAVVIQHFQDMAKYDYENAPLEAEAFKANIKYR